MTLERIGVIQSNIKSTVLDGEIIDNFCKSINDFVSRSEWVHALKLKESIDVSNVQLRALPRSIYLDRRTFANKDCSIGCYECSTSGLIAWAGVAAEISRYAFRYCFEHSQLDKFTPDINSDLFNNNYVILNGYVRWEVKRDYLEKAPTDKKLIVHCDDLPNGVYIVPNGALGPIKFKTPAEIDDSSIPVTVEISELEDNEAAKTKFIQSKVEQGYDEKEAGEVVGTMLLLHIMCAFEYYPAKDLEQKIICIVENDNLDAH